MAKNNYIHPILIATAITQTLCGEQHRENISDYIEIIEYTTLEKI